MYVINIGALLILAAVWDVPGVDVLEYMKEQ